MNHLEFWEADAILANIKYAYYNEWEVCRNQMYVIAQTQSRKKLSPKGILKLPWDEENTENIKENNTEVSAEDRARVIAKAQKFADQMTNE